MKAKYETAHLEPNWKSPQAMLCQLIPQALLPWLQENHSMTQRIEAHNNMMCTVVPLQEGWHVPRRSEQVQYGLGAQAAWVREVVIYGNDHACMVARTVIPQRTCWASGDQLRRLGSMPLGRWLFKEDHSVKRIQMQWAQLKVHHSDFQTAQAWCAGRPQQLWARSSCLLWNAYPLLVNEIFLPRLLSVAEAGCV